MIHLDVENEQRKYAWALVHKHNFGKRGKFDGDMNEQYTGMLGETVMADELNALFNFSFAGKDEYPRPDGSKGFDNGIDFEMWGHKCDLKTMGRKWLPKIHYENNLIVSQTDSATEFYIFASYSKVRRILTICGWNTKEECIKSPQYGEGVQRDRDDGTSFVTGTGMFEVRNDTLRPCNSLYELAIDINQFYSNQ